MRDLKRWCLAQLHSMEVRLTGEPSGTKLPHSPSAAEGADEDEGAGPTAPPRSQGTQPLDLHGHTVQLGEEGPSVAEAGAANHYFVVHVESSPGNQLHLNPPVWLFSGSFSPSSIQKLSENFKMLAFIVRLEHRSQTGGPRSGFGPRSNRVWTRTYNPLIIR